MVSQLVLFRIRFMKFITVFEERKSFLYARELGLNENTFCLFLSDFVMTGAWRSHVPVGIEPYKPDSFGPR